MRGTSFTDYRYWERYKDTGKVKPYLIFGLTDETYSLVCSQPYVKNENKTAYYFTVTLLNPHLLDHRRSYRQRPPEAYFPSTAKESNFP